MERPGNQEHDERQMRYKLSEGYRWLWVGLVFILVFVVTNMNKCFGY